MTIYALNQSAFVCITNMMITFADDDSQNVARVKLGYTGHGYKDRSDIRVYSQTQIVKIDTDFFGLEH